VTCAVYAHKHRLLEEEGLKWFKGIAKREKKMHRMVNQSCIKATRNAPRYKFSYCIPCNYNEAMQLDLKIGNAYLEAFTIEWSYIFAGPEFCQLEGHYLIIIK
jgi:hypothetical protein